MIQNWMTWEGGVDFVGMTAPNLSQPNVMLHVARMVHTPVGSAPAGMVLYQPDPSKAPAVLGFICPDAKVGRYFGPHIFAGTPFESAPVLNARIAVSTELPKLVRSRVEVAGLVFESELSELGALAIVHRQPGAMPFHQQGLEAEARRVSLMVNGVSVPLTVPPVSLSGAPGALWAPNGLYAR